MSPLIYSFGFVWLLLLSTSEGLSEADDASLLWGPYRPNLYVGIRPRLRVSLVAGLMWSNADSFTSLFTSMYPEDSIPSINDLSALHCRSSTYL